jgi:hypothetical protein
MSRRRALLVAILVYVTLDLSLPAMPGAFVFEPDDSVESIGGGRQPAKVVVVPAPGGRSWLAWARPPVPLRDRLMASRAVAPVERPASSRMPRATYDRPPSSEDPH